MHHDAGARRTTQSDGLVDEVRKPMDRLGSSVTLLSAITWFKDWSSTASSYSFGEFSYSWYFEETSSLREGAEHTYLTIDGGGGGVTYATGMLTAGGFLFLTFFSLFVLVGGGFMMMIHDPFVSGAAWGGG